jgi:elongation factor Ts
MTQMPEISAKLVMTLRDRTNLPMMKCKQALEATKGSHASEDAWINAAIEHLRKSGLAAMDKLAGRDATNGGIGMALGSGKGVIVLLSCQTDFVSGNDTFKELVKSIADAALASGATTVEALNQAKIGGQTVLELLATKTLQIGERLVISKVLVVTGAVVTGYNHGGKVAALVAGSGDAQLLRSVSLHVASANPAPVSLDRSGVDPVLVKKEEEILLATPELQGKPEAMRPKIVQGKLGRFFRENVLLEQEMVVGAEKGETVEKYAKRNSLTVTAFARLAV